MQQFHKTYLPSSWNLKEQPVPRNFNFIIQLEKLVDLHFNTHPDYNQMFYEDEVS